MGHQVTEGGAAMDDDDDDDDDDVGGGGSSPKSSGQCCHRQGRPRPSSASSRLQAEHVEVRGCLALNPLASTWTTAWRYPIPARRRLREPPVRRDSPLSTRTGTSSNCQPIKPAGHTNPAGPSAGWMVTVGADSPQSHADLPPPIHYPACPLSTAFRAWPGGGRHEPRHGPRMLSGLNTDRSYPSSPTTIVSLTADACAM
ncbi:hypothetical protein S40293_10984 [Stachybotrys chartarum IBT 40293]|nr:hypothetical protein S40293_10984 [Stachybotrys chartarum IBT 40293]